MPSLMLRRSSLPLLQPLELPRRVRLVRENDVAEHDQRTRRHHDAHHQQVAQLCEDVQLGLLLLLGQLVHRVHQTLEDPEVDERIHATPHTRLARSPRRDEQPHVLGDVVVGGVHCAVGVPERHQVVDNAEGDETAHGAIDGGVANAKTHTDEQHEHTRESARGAVDGDGEKGENEGVVARVVEDGEREDFHGVVDYEGDDDDEDDDLHTHHLLAVGDAEHAPHNHGDHVEETHKGVEGKTSVLGGGQVAVGVLHDHCAVHMERRHVVVTTTVKRENQNDMAVTT